MPSGPTEPLHDALLYEIRVWINANRGDIKLEFFEHDWGLNDTALANNES